MLQAEKEEYRDYLIDDKYELATIPSSDSDDPRISDEDFEGHKNDGEDAKGSTSSQCGEDVHESESTNGSGFDENSRRKDLW